MQLSQVTIKGERVFSVNPEPRSSRIEDRAVLFTRASESELFGGFKPEKGLMHSVRNAVSKELDMVFARLKSVPERLTLEGIHTLHRSLSEMSLPFKSLSRLDLAKLHGQKNHDVMSPAGALVTAVFYHNDVYQQVAHKRKEVEALRTTAQHVGLALKEQLDRHLKEFKSSMKLVYILDCLQDLMIPKIYPQLAAR